MNLCSKPGCGAPGAAVLAYDYEARAAVIGDAVEGDISPHLYVLCSRCAERLNPPRGWTLADERTEPPLFLDAEVTQLHATEAPAEELEPEPATERKQLFFGYSA